MDAYTSPFAERYSSKEMLYNFSNDKKFTTWRQLWITLAEFQQQSGLVTEAQVAELKAHASDINYDVAREYEQKLKHDVMAHIRAYGDQCPSAKGIIHLGATSAYVVDNTDIICLRDGYKIIQKELVNVINALAAFARTYMVEPTVAFTHFQPAQFTTIGKRTCLWIQDLMLDLEEIESRLARLRILGAKGTTGTQASFLTLFNGDEEKVKDLDDYIGLKLGFYVYPVSGQTYSRKIDAQAQSALSGIAESSHKFANDMRLLQHLGELQEPFGKDQVGSSAMAYKRNPMKSERITSLARLVLSLQTNANFTAASQWFERTLDDSAGKRVALPEAFLAVDAILQLYLDIATNMTVNLGVINKNVQNVMSDIASENLLMEAVKVGGDRQELHEIIRRHKMSSTEDLFTALKKEPAFSKVTFPDPKPVDYIGMAPLQVSEYLRDVVVPKLETYRDMLDMKPQVRV